MVSWSHDIKRFEDLMLYYIQYLSQPTFFFIPDAEPELETFTGQHL